MPINQDEIPKRHRRDRKKVLPTECGGVGSKSKEDNVEFKEKVREKLLNAGFRVDVFNGEECLILTLEKGKDRFYHKLRWYADEPERFYIDCLLTSDTKTLTEKEFLINTNGLASHAINQYKKIVQELSKTE